MAYLSIAACILLGALNTLLSKKFQTSFSTNILNFAKYNLINSLFACFFLSALNGFTFRLNLETFGFSLAYALIVIASLTFSLFAYKFVSVSLVGVISTSGSVIISSLFSMIFLGETPTFQTISSVVLMVIAVVVPYIGKKENFSKATIPICLAYFIVTGAGSVVLKLFTISPTVTDSKSLFIMTNVVIVVCAIVVMLCLLIIKKATVKEILKPFSLKQNANIITRTALSNVSSVLSVFAIALMSLSVYSVTSSSLGIISACLLSIFFFKERPSAMQIVSVIISVLALVITLF